MPVFLLQSQHFFAGIYCFLLPQRSPWITLESQYKYSLLIINIWFSDWINVTVIFFLFWLQMTCTVWNKCKKKKMNLWLYWLKAELALKALHWSQNAAAICCNANYFLPCKIFFGGADIFTLLTSAFKKETLYYRSKPPAVKKKGPDSLGPGASLWLLLNPQQWKMSIDQWSLALLWL